MNEAVFNRTDTSEGVVFDIRPAVGHPFALILIFAIYAFAVFVKMVSPWSDWWLYLLCAGAALHFFHWRKYRRAPVKLLVSREGIRAGANFYAPQDIRSLHLTKPGTNGGTEWAEDSALDRANERSYVFALRLKSSSRLVPIARGMTVRTGRMLISDIGKILGFD